MLRASSAGETAPSQERVCINIIHTRSPPVCVGLTLNCNKAILIFLSQASLLDESMYSADVYVSYRVSRKSRSIALEIGDPMFSSYRHFNVEF